LSAKESQHLGPLSLSSSLLGPFKETVGPKEEEESEDTDAGT